MFLYRCSFQCDATMPLTAVFFTLWTLSELGTVLCYTYQTKPLFLSFSELEGNEPTFYLTDPEMKTFVVDCGPDSVEVAFKVHLFDPGRPVEPEDLRLGPVARHHCRAKASGSGDYVIKAALADCGGAVTVGSALGRQNKSSCCHLVILF